MCEEPTDEQRKQLALFASKPKCRIVGRPSKGMPSDWHPNNINNPESGFSFSEAGAWDLIGELINQGDRIQAIKLDKPPGTIGYVMKHQLSDERVIYIKFHFGNGKIVGRSFHYDY